MHFIHELLHLSPRQGHFKQTVKENQVCSFIYLFEPGQQIQPSLDQKLDEQIFRSVRRSSKYGDSIQFELSDWPCSSHELRFPHFFFCPTS